MLFVKFLTSLKYEDKQIIQKENIVSNKFYIREVFKTINEKYDRDEKYNVEKKIPDGYSYKQTLDIQIDYNLKYLEILFSSITNIDYLSFEEKLLSSLERDIFTGSTNHGPHKDDLNISADGIDLRKFGSQGQQKSSSCKQCYLWFQRLGWLPRIPAPASDKHSCSMLRDNPCTLHVGRRSRSRQNS